MPDLADLLGPPRKIHCPFHQDAQPSAMLYDDGGLHCFGCGEHAHNRTDLIRKVYFPDEPYSVGINLARAMLQVEGVGVVQVNTGEPRHKPGATPAAISAMTAFTELACRELERREDLIVQIRQTRGIKDPVKMKLGVSTRLLVNPLRNLLAKRGMKGSDIDLAMTEAGITWQDQQYRLGYRVVIPEVRKEKTVYYQARAILPDETKYLNPSLPRPIFGLQSLDVGNSFIFIGEGPFDVLPFIEAGESALAILGAHGNEDFVDHLEHRQVVVGFDRDEVGMERGAFLASGLRLNGVDAIHLPPPPKFKDYCEWIANDGIQNVIDIINWELP